MRKRGLNRGFISYIVVAIIAIVLLKVWFGFDLFKWLNTPEVKTFFFKIWDVILMIWNKYVSDSFQSFVRFVKDIINKNI